MSDIVVIGDRDTVLAFQLGGIDGYVVSDANGARQAVGQARNSARRAEPPASRTKLVLVTHQVADLLGGLSDMDSSGSSVPLLLEIPGFGDVGGRRPLQQLLARVLRIGR